MLKAVHCFLKTFHLRYLTKFWISLAILYQWFCYFLLWISYCIEISQSSGFFFPLSRKHLIHWKIFSWCSLSIFETNTPEAEHKVSPSKILLNVCFLRWQWFYIVKSNRLTSFSICHGVMWPWCHSRISFFFQNTKVLVSLER